MATCMQGAQSYNERINTIKQYIHEHMDEPLNRELLAELAGFSVPHFHRIFTAHVGENISAYGRRVHMERAARQLLANEANITQIAKEVRFDAGVILVDGEEPPVSDGMGYQTLPGGRWAIFRHIGPYETLWQSWQGIYRDWLPTSAYELRDAIPFEEYVDDPSVVERAKLRTDIYIPIQ